MRGQRCGGRVLIVEDDADIRDALCEALRDGDYHPAVATDGAAALDELRSGAAKPCVILLDIMMPVLDGPGFRARQKADPELAGIPVVVLSAHADARTMAEELHAEAFIKKPLDLDNLLGVVERFCAGD